MPFDGTDYRPGPPGSGASPPTWLSRVLGWAFVALYALVWAMHALLLALCIAIAAATGQWLDGAGTVALTTMLFLPFRLPLADLRAIAAGRWP